mgnify:CR=1 FL=1
MNEPSSRISHPAKFANNQYVSHTCQAVTRVHAYVPPCLHYPRHKRQTPWHPLAQSRATAGNLKQLRVRRAYVRCSSWKTREKTFALRTRPISVSVRIHLFYTSAWFHYLRGEFSSRFIVDYFDLISKLIF